MFRLPWWGNLRCALQILPRQVGHPQACVRLCAHVQGG